MKECILLFSVNDPALKAAVRRAFAPLHVALRAVDPADHALTLGELAAGTGSGANDSSSPGSSADAVIPAPMLVFAGLPPAKFNMALQSLRAQRAVIPHKAVLTPTNAAWTPGKLFAEIDAERRAIEEASRK